MFRYNNSKFYFNHMFTRRGEVKAIAGEQTAKDMQRLRCDLVILVALATAWPIGASLINWNGIPTYLKFFGQTGTPSSGVIQVVDDALYRTMNLDGNGWLGTIYRWTAASRQSLRSPAPEEFHPGVLFRQTTAYSTVHWRATSIRTPIAGHIRIDWPTRHVG